jgi:hypothetical protein
LTAEDEHATILANYATVIVSSEEPIMGFVSPYLESAAPGFSVKTIGFHKLPGVS